MKNFKSVFKREFKSYFNSPVAYVFIITFLIATAGCTFYLGSFYERMQADLSAFFMWHPWLYLFLIPAIGMRIWAEERKSGSIELLFTLPITVTEAVLAKFAAAWAFVGVALILTFPIVVTVNFLGNPDNGIIVASYLGSFLMAGAYMAVACVTSALTKNQVISFVMSVIICFVLVLTGLGVFTQHLVNYMPVAVSDFISMFSFSTHFNSLQRGVIDSRDIVFFVSMIASLLVANVLILEHKKHE
ncbi:ABC transporter permease subunit [bacterium]|nr:ABC transporter permease subunit [bacterium]